MVCHLLAESCMINKLWTWFGPHCIRLKDIKLLIVRADVGSQSLVLVFLLAAYCVNTPLHISQVPRRPVKMTSWKPCPWTWESLRASFSWCKTVTWTGYHCGIPGLNDQRKWIPIFETCQYWSAVTLSMCGFYAIKSTCCQDTIGLFISIDPGFRCLRLHLPDLPLSCEVAHDRILITH